MRGRRCGATQTRVQLRKRSFGAESLPESYDVCARLSYVFAPMNPRRNRGALTMKRAVIAIFGVVLMRGHVCRYLSRVIRGKSAASLISHPAEDFCYPKPRSGNLRTGIAKPLVIHKHHVLLSFARGHSVTDGHGLGRARSSRVNARRVMPLHYSRLLQALVRAPQYCRGSDEGY